MPKRVNIPGVGAVNFPDSLSDEQLTAEVQRIAANAPAAALKAAPDDSSGPSVLENAIGVLGRAGGLGIPGGELGGVLSNFVQPDNLAASGAAVGGLIAGVPGAAAGGAIGSKTGKTLRRLEDLIVKGTKPTASNELTDDLNAVGRGAVEGGAQFVGGKLAQGVGKVGKVLYTKALAPSKALQAEFPDLVETGIRKGFNVTPKGATQAEAAREASSATARGIVSAASPTAAPVVANEVTGATKPAFAALRGARSIGKDVAGDQAALSARAKRIAGSFGGRPAEPARVVTRAAVPPGVNPAAAEGQIAQMAGTAPSSAFSPAAEAEVRAARELGPGASTIPRSVLRGAPPAPKEPVRFVSPGRPAEPGGISLIEAQGRKEAAQGASQAAYKARNRGAAVSDTDLMTDEGLARMYRQAIETRAPEVAGVNKETQSLMGIERALADAETRPHMLRFLSSVGIGGGASMLAGPGGLAAGAASYAATSPRVLGRAGIMLGRAGSETGEQVGANLLRAALMNQMGADVGEQP